MRLQKYLDLSGVDENFNKFRMLNINICKNKTEHINTVRDIEEQYSIEKSIIKEVNELNKELKKIYGNKYSFQFCLDEGDDINEITKNKYRDKLKRMFMGINDKFSNVKFDIEKKLSKDK
jgi:hypothetical protein